MALENLVRPAVFPDIRPPPPQVAQLPPAAEGTTEIKGGSGRLITLSHSWSVSITHPHETEKERTFDLVRVKNPDDKEQHVDVEVVNKMKLKDQVGMIRKVKYTREDAGGETETTEILQRDIVRPNPLSD